MEKAVFQKVDRIAKNHGGELTVSDKDMERDTVSWFFADASSRNRFADRVGNRYGYTGDWAQAEFEYVDGKGNEKAGLTIG